MLRGVKQLPSCRLPFGEGDDDGHIIGGGAGGAVVVDVDLEDVAVLEVGLSVVAEVGWGLQLNGRAGDAQVGVGEELVVIGGRADLDAGRSGVGLLRRVLLSSCEEGLF